MIQKNINKIGDRYSHRLRIIVTPRDLPDYTKPDGRTRPFGSWNTIQIVNHLSGYIDAITVNKHSEINSDKDMREHNEWMAREFFKELELRFEADPNSMEMEQK